MSSDSDSSPLYLGFDLSTQQLKAIVVTSDLAVVSEAKADFDADFGQRYGIQKGVRTNEAEGEVFAPVAMWLEALELVLTRLRDDKACPLHRIRGVSGSGQQHGSVFWNQSATAALAKLDPARPLADQLADTLAYPNSPNWQDHSTQAECDLFDAHLGSPERLADVTGSSAHHRFTGTQIMRMRRRRPEIYSSTDRISLVSSFLASLLLGNIAPIDCSDVTGMDMWDIKAETWSESLLELTAGDGDGAVAELRRKLGEVRLDGGGSIGAISDFYVQRFGFHRDCQVVSFTGDNPATILSLPLRPGDAMVSLGTSTTFLMNTDKYRPDPSYHFMNHPTTRGNYMFMLCYKNGGLAREKVRDALPQASKAESNDPWAPFNAQVLSTPPLGVGESEDRARLGLYFPLPEIVPNIQAGTWRFTCGASDGSGLTEVAEKDWPREADARAIVESQALSMRLRSQNLVSSPGQGLPAQPRRIYLVGGGSLNPAIARVLGDVLGGAEGLYKLDVGGNACALGGAYKAVWALERSGPGETFDALIGRRWKEEGAIARADEGYRADGTFERYGAVLGAFEEAEKRVLKDFKN